MVEERYLLNDDAMKRFIVWGWLVVKPDFPPGFHDSVVRRIAELYQAEGDPGSAILDRVPAIGQVYNHPAVRGALVSLLGPDVAMHEHHICHRNPPGFPGQVWHQDAINVRHHQIRRVLAFYFPQDVTPEMGPTTLLPGTQYRNAPAVRMATYGKFKAQVPLVVEAGMVVLMHYDLWHRGTPNRSDQTRYMLKFIFERTKDPARPSWRAEPARREVIMSELRKTYVPIDSETDAYKHQVIWMQIWKWLHGEPCDRRDLILAYLP